MQADSSKGEFNPWGSVEERRRPALREQAIPVVLELAYQTVKTR